MNIDIATIKELPKPKISKKKVEKSKKIKQVEYLDQMLTKKWLSDYFNPEKTSRFKKK
jgi:hypothetical protein